MRRRAAAAALSVVAATPVAAAVATPVATAAGGAAAIAYVTDELVLNVYAEQNGQGQRLATLHSGASVEPLGTAGDSTQVRLADGVTGWVKSTYLTTHVPATVRVKQLEEELDRSRATTPALAEAAARSELGRLQQRLADEQSELDAALAARARAPEPGTGTAHPPHSIGLAGAGCALLAIAALGFWSGYATLARRVRRKFGGLKVY